MDGPRSTCDLCERPFDFEDRTSRMAPRLVVDPFTDYPHEMFVCADCKRQLREEWAARQAMDDLYADSYRDTL
jgi:uncharacterized protein YlaI